MAHRNPAEEGQRAAAAENLARKRAANVTRHEIAFHRNGMCGAPFYVITFTHKLTGARPMVAIVFSQPGACSVFDRAKLGAGVIAFGDGEHETDANAWRGDKFEDDLRAVVVLARGMEAFT